MSLLKKFGQGVSRLSQGARRAHNDILDIRDDAIINSMVKKVDPNFTNGYLGLKPTAGMNIAAVGLAGAYASAGVLKVQTKSNPGTVEYENQAPIKSGDGMGASNAPSLGASGSLVFGLNAMRRG